MLAVLAMFEFGVMAFFIHGNPELKLKSCLIISGLYSNQEPKIMCLHKHLFSIITETGERQKSLLVFCYCLSASSFWAGQFGGG